MLGFPEKSKTEWFRAFTISGRPAGLGAVCPVCQGAVRYGLSPGMTFEHCGRKEPVPENLDGLPCKSLKRGMPDVSQGFLVLDTWQENDGGWEQESNSKSDDPSAWEVKWA